MALLGLMLDAAVWDWGFGNEIGEVVCLSLSS